MSEFIELLKIAAVGIISGTFSILITLRRHRHEKWWDMRVSAYQAAIESLSDLVNYYEVMLATCNNREHHEKAVNELGSPYDQARIKIRKLKDTGIFLFSKDAIAELEHFSETKIDYSDVTVPDDIYHPYLSSASKCLNNLVRISKKDLKITESWL